MSLRAFLLFLFLAPGCDALPEATPADLGCGFASDCGLDEFCTIQDGYGVCSALPDHCAFPADCADSTCREALEATCNEGLAEECSNPIDRDSHITGNPVLICS